MMIRFYALTNNKFLDVFFDIFFLYKVNKNNFQRNELFFHI